MQGGMNFDAEAAVVLLAALQMIFRGTILIGAIRRMGLMKNWLDLPVNTCNNKKNFSLEIGNMLVVRHIPL